MNFYPNTFRFEKNGPQNQQKLFEEYKLGDLKARETLIYNNLSIVTDRIKKRFANTIFEKKDLFSIGTIGLIKAIDTFDTGMGYSFYTYASKCIDNEILMYLRKNSNVSCNISYDRFLDEEGKSSILKLIASNESIEEDFLQKKLYHDIQKIVASLPEREKCIIEKYFGINCIQIYLKDIAKNLHIPQSHASKIKARALKRIETMLNEYGYDDLGISRQKIKGETKNGK